jgi:hypothetical protein
MTAAKNAQRAIGVPGVGLAVAGGALVLVAFRFLAWYDAPARTDAAPRVTFGQLHGNADQLGTASTATAYFDWLGWVLLLALVALGVAANLPGRPSDALRVAGFLLGVVGVGATYFAVAQLHNAQVAAGAARHSVFFHATWGLWLTLAGFALGAIGAALGPRTVAP